MPVRCLRQLHVTIYSLFIIFKFHHYSAASATVAINNGTNAGLLAVRTLAASIVSPTLVILL